MNLPRIPILIQQSLVRTLRMNIHKSNQLLKQNYILPKLTYQQKGTTAGTAWLQNWEIRLNPIFLLENQQAFIDEVIPHELAHLLVWKKFGRVAPHGKEWRWMMESVLEISPCRTHQFDITSIPSQQFSYHCDCQQHHLSLRRHNRVLRGTSKYCCTQCGTLLQPNAS